jgi:hypothetical protein
MSSSKNLYRNNDKYFLKMYPQYKFIHTFKINKNLTFKKFPRENTKYIYNI